MLKTIYNFLLVTLLSGSLLVLDFGVKGAQLKIGFSQSYAQTSDPNNNPPQKVKLDGAKDNDLMATLTMTSIGLLAQRLYKCKLTADMMVAAAGGAAYIAGDIMATFSLKKVMKDLEKEVKKTNTVTDANNQIEDFKKLKKSYEDAKGTANTKKMLQMAAAAAFLIAAGIAAYQAITMEVSQKTCIAGLASAANACAAQAAAEASNPATAAKAPITAAGGAEAAAAAATEAARGPIIDVPAPSGSKLGPDTAQITTETAKQTVATGKCPLVATASANCKTGYTLEHFKKGVCLVPPALALNSILKFPLFGDQKFVNYTPVSPAFSLADLFFPRANADLFSPLGIISGAAISFALMTSATLGIQIDTFLFSPKNRAIIWGVLAGLVYMASTATDNQINTIEQNIKKIQAIIDELEALRKGNPTAPGSNPNNPSKPDLKPAGVKGNEFSIANDGRFQDVDMSKDGVKFPCINGEYTNRCDNFSSLLNEKTKDLKDLPPDLRSQLGDISSLADGINGTGTLSTATMAKAASLASQANALRANLNSKTKQLQDRLNRNKNNKIDLAQRSNAIKNSLLGTVAKELEKRGTTASKMLASFGASGAIASKYAASTGGSDSSGENSASGANGENAAGAIDPNALKNSAAVIDIGAGASSELSEAAKAGSNETNGGDALAGQSANGANGEGANPTKTASMDDYDLKNDINLNKDVDLFKVITNRYQKSAYPRLFKRVK